MTAPTRRELVLGALRAGASTPKQVAAHLGLLVPESTDPAMLVRDPIARLCAAGIIEQTQDPDDARQSILRETAAKVPPNALEEIIANLRTAPCREIPIAASMALAVVAALRDGPKGQHPITDAVGRALACWRAQETLPIEEIKTRAGELYLRRHVAVRRGDCNVYLHEFVGSDPQDLHDHPWAFLSMVLAGGYTEHTDRGAQRYEPGDVLFRKAADRHRIEVTAPATSLVITGAFERPWGFWRAGAFVPWREYTGATR